MAIGSWEPPSTTPAEGPHIDRSQLTLFIDLAQNEQLEELATRLDVKTLRTQASLMKLDESAWRAEAANWSDEELWQLIRFFTVAEGLPGWEAGDQSPVIWLNRALKQRGKPLDQMALRWIKAHSRNRFLPNGSLL